MFKDFYGMQRSPFVSSIDTGSLYMSPALDETLSRLHYAASHQLFAVVTAEVGCGKSTSIRCFTRNSIVTRYLLMYHIFLVL